MENGIYEKVLSLSIEKDLENSKLDYRRKIDKSELPKVLATRYEKEIRKKLELMDEEEGLDLIKNLNILLSMDLAMEEDSFVELLASHDQAHILKELKENRPKTSIANSSLFTGASGPSLESELAREIRTADEIHMLVSFIKFSGLRLIYDDLVEFTKRGKLKVITTSYMGASDYKAIVELAKLPNTQVKISYDTKRTRLHAKAYYFKRKTGFTTAYIGSSNLSNPALSNGLEWNLKVSEYTSKDVVNSFVKNFESYWNDEEFVSFNPDDPIERKELKTSLNPEFKNDKDYVFFDLRPYSHQKEILEDLRLERQVYNSNKNLVVSATGTGKTMVAAFDYKEQLKTGEKKLLFLAHRKEILEQSLYTFRNVLKDQNFGDLWINGNIDQGQDHVFASIQTLISQDKYRDIARDYFDYIVIDESHHIGASSYFQILEYFQPKILLGLTATPERMDGKNILEYFNNRIASEIRLTDAINRKLLTPFHYFGVTDSEDLSNLKWSRGGYEISQLENLYTKSKQRVETIISAMNRYLKDMETFKALGFCVSIKHAEFMSEAFNKAGIPSIALHSASSPEERASAKARLSQGEINCIFTVDLFNEGVDIPEIDTVLFLRPTESLTVFIQQLGRGLRLHEGKEVLTVLDFIGQAHINYDFSFKMRVLLGKTRKGMKDEILNEFPNMPAGCHIKLEKIAKDYILNNIQSSIFNIRQLRRLAENYHLNFTSELNLKNFLDNYGIDKDQFYARYSFYELIKEDYSLGDEKELRQSLRRFSRIDSKRLLEFSRKLLTDQIDLGNLNDIQTKMLGMVHYSLWGDVPKISYKDSMEKLKRDNAYMVSELLELIDYNLSTIKNVEIEYDDPDIPLDIYASYNLDQIMVAFDKTYETYKYPLREGVLYIEDKHADLLFITINKNEEDYLPSTMYNDYAKNNRLFNWESQSKTSPDSPTGQRYINGEDPDHKVLLFVRENKQEYGTTAPYRFIGNASYYSHRGSQPIEILWKMDHEIPEKIIRESSLRVVN